MTVYIEKPAVNLREELASLRNQGGYEEQQFYFDNLVINGTFDTDTSGWSAGNGATLSFDTGTMLVENTAANNAYAYQPTSTEVGKTYVFTADFINTGGFSVRLQASNSITTNIIGTTAPASGDRTEVLTFTATATTTYIWLQIISGNAAASFNIDNISVYETDGTDVVHKMPKGWVPLHVYEDGLLQREGAAHDYEVVYDGFDYYVKPAVAPGATTETCVIGVRK